MMISVLAKTAILALLGLTLTASTAAQGEEAGRMEAQKKLEAEKRSLDEEMLRHLEAKRLRREGASAIEKGDYATALRLLRPLAEQGDAWAQYNLGVMYHSGQGVPQDYAEAVKWYRKSAEQGNAKAQLNFGLMYLNGRGVLQNDAEAMKWVRKAVEQGDANAQYNLGVMYDKGNGVPQDYAEARKWYSKSAAQGNASAQFNLGAMYYKGQGVPKNEAEAVSWYRMAAEQGHSWAQFNLGVMYDEGRGVPQNGAEAVNWYRKSAEQGNASAQFNLGAVYNYGRGVPQNDAEAVKWYRKAADQGDADAQNSLGVMYAKGNGVVQNYVLAHMWFNLASAAHYLGEAIRNRTRENRDKIARSMTPQQIEQAQALAAKWQPKSGETKGASGDIRKEASAEAEVVSTGTGFFVSQQGHLLTNHHVIGDCASVRLRPAGLPPARAALVARDPHNDLALLKSESRPAAVAVFPPRKQPQLGQSAIIFGFPLTGVLSSSGNLTTGAVSALSGLQDDPRLFQISAPVQPGNSGGPVMDASGAIIGVVVGKLNARAVEKVIADIPQNVNFAIKGAVAVGFLDSNAIDYVRDLSDKAIAVEEIAKRATRFTVLVECLK